MYRRMVSMALFFSSGETRALEPTPPSLIPTIARCMARFEAAAAVCVTFHATPTAARSSVAARPSTSVWLREQVPMIG